MIKIIQRIKPPYEAKECDRAIISWDIQRCKNYEKDVYGHLIMISLNLKVVWFQTKIYIQI